MIVPLLVAAALAGAPATPPADAWPLLERAASAAAAVPASPALVRVREAHAHVEPLLDEDIVASLDSARATSSALDLLDAAVVARGCRVPAPSWDAAGSATPGTVWDALTTLGDHALAAALVDGADGKKSRAVANVGRAADLAALLARCEAPSLAAFLASQTIAERARVVSLSLAEQRQIDARGLSRLVAALEPSVNAAFLERAMGAEQVRAGQEKTPEQEAALAAAGRRLDEATARQAALALASKDFDGIARVARVAAVRCAPGLGGRRYVVSRAVVSLLSRRGQELLANDSLALPDLTGSIGLVIVRAGPIARSCGFQEQDVVVAVNGVELRRVEQALVDAPARVAHDRRALFVVRRAGEMLEWQVEVDEAR